MNNDTSNNRLEILFWNVFRNIFILKQILRNIKSLNRYYKSYSYYEATNLYWLLKNNHHGLIKDKLNRLKYSNSNNNNNNIELDNSNNSNIFFKIDNDSLSIIGLVKDEDLFKDLLDYWLNNYKLCNPLNLSDSNGGLEFLEGLGKETSTSGSNGRIRGSGGYYYDEDYEDELENDSIMFVQTSDFIKPLIARQPNSERDRMAMYDRSAYLLLQGVLKFNNLSRLSYFLEKVDCFSSFITKEDSIKSILARTKLNISLDIIKYFIDYIICGNINSNNNNNSNDSISGNNNISNNNNNKINSNNQILLIQFIKDQIKKHNETSYLNKCNIQEYREFLEYIVQLFIDNKQLYQNNSNYNLDSGVVEELINLYSTEPTIPLELLRIINSKTQGQLLVKIPLVKIIQKIEPKNYQAIEFLTSVYGLEALKSNSSVLVPRFIKSMFDKHKSIIKDNQQLQNQQYQQYQQYQQEQVKVLWYFFNNQFELSVNFTSIVAFLGEYELLLEWIKRIENEYNNNNVLLPSYISPVSLELACLNGIPMYSTHIINSTTFSITIDNIVSRFESQLGTFNRLLERYPKSSSSEDSINENEILFIGGNIIYETNNAFDIFDEDDHSNLPIEIVTSRVEYPVNSYISKPNFNISLEFKFLESSKHELYNNYISKRTSESNERYFKIVKILAEHVTIDENLFESLAIATGIGSNKLIIDYFLKMKSKSTTNIINAQRLLSTLCYFNQKELFMDIILREPSTSTINLEDYSLWLRASLINSNQDLYEFISNLPYYNHVQPLDLHLLVFPILNGSTELVKLLHQVQNHKILDTYISLSILINSTKFQQLNKYLFQQQRQFNSNNNINDKNNNISDDNNSDNNNLDRNISIFNNRNEIIKYLILNKKFKISKSLTMACYMENVEIINYILDSINEPNQYVSDNNNSDIRVLLCQGSNYSIIEKILETKLKYQNTGEYQRFIPEIFIIAFINGHIKTGELFIKSKYVNWDINRIDPTNIAPILYHCREEFIIEFLFKNKCLSELYSFFTKTTVVDFSLILSSFTNQDTVSLFLAFHCITLRNGGSNSKLKTQFYLGDFFFNILKVLVFQCDLSALIKLSNVELFQRYFNWDLFVFSVQFQCLPIISFLFSKTLNYIIQNQKYYQLSDLIEDYYDNIKLKQLFNNLKSNIRNKKKKINH